MKKLKILSIDGGGIRGIIPCTILQHIEGKIGKPLSEVFDLIVGTSTGGIISLGLASSNPNNSKNKPFSAKELLKIYTEEGDKIFDKRQRNILSTLLGWLPKGEVFDSPYSSESLEKLLKEKFGETKLSDVKTNILITSYDIHKRMPFYYIHRMAREDSSEDFLLREIARSTSAAPTYFTPANVEHEKEGNLSLVDGGVFANNPSILGYCEAKELWKENWENIQSGQKVFQGKVKSTDDDFPFFMLSIGTGNFHNPIKGEDAAKFKKLNWFEPMLTDVFMQGVSESTHYAMQHLLPNYTDGTPRYVRLNIDIPEANSEMDNVESANILELQRLSNAFVKKNKALLNKISTKYLM